MVRNCPATNPVSTFSGRVAHCACQTRGHAELHQQIDQNEVLFHGSAENWPDEQNVARGAEMPRFNFCPALAGSSSVDQYGPIIPPICRDTGPAAHSFCACIFCPSITSRYFKPEPVLNRTT